jgi:hypothetical protein
MLNLWFKYEWVSSNTRNLISWVKRNLQFPSTPWFAKKKGQSKKQTRLGDRHATRQSAMERGKSCFPMSNVTRNDDACAGRQDEAGDVRSILHIKTIHIRPSVRLLLTPLFLGLPPPKVWLGSRVKRIQCHSLTGPRQMMTMVLTEENRFLTIS